MNLEWAPGSSNAHPTDRSISEVRDSRHHLPTRRLVLRLSVRAGRPWKPERRAESYHHLNRPGKPTPAGPRSPAPTDIRRYDRRAALHGQQGCAGLRLAQAKCPTHDQGPTNVRLHFDASGAGDLKYESCCEKLGEAIAKLV